MELLPRDLKIDFLKLFKFVFPVTIILTIVAFYVWFERGESKWGLDFTGGYELTVRVPKEVSSDDIRVALNEAQIKEPIVQSFEVGSSEYSIRLNDEGEESSVVYQRVESALKAKPWGSNLEVLKTDYVGPTAGHELRSQALIASIIGILGILVYVTIRFEFAFALGAIVALFHDVVLAVGIYLLLGYTMSMGTIAAILTIIGYSVNDTIVIFDRVREEILKSRSYNLADIINHSVNLLLSRTLITSGLTLFSALALFIFGGGAIKDLTLFLVLGIIFGTYSTVYIAAPVVLSWHKWRGGKVVVER